MKNMAIQINFSTWFQTKKCIRYANVLLIIQIAKYWINIEWKLSAVCFGYVKL